MNQTTSYTYTSKGQLETTTLPNGTVLRTVYNGLGQKVQEIADDGGLNLTTHYSFDLKGNLETVTDPEGVVTRYTYDALNRRTSMVQDDGGLKLLTTYRYSEDGNTVYTTNPRGVVTVDTSDALNRPVSLRHDAEGLNLETRYSYTAAGNLETITDPRGTVTQYAYDEMNRRTAIHEDATGLNLISRSDYDRLGNLAQVIDADGTVSLLEQNAFGLPVRHVRDVGGREIETRSTYDSNLNLLAITDDNGNTTQYRYNANNHRTQTRYADRTTVTQTYTPLGAVDTRTDQAGRTIDYDYDDVGRLTGKTFPGGSQSMTYDANGRVRTATQTMNGHATSVSFSYDHIGSVLEFTQTVDGVSWTTSYDYDYVAGTVTMTFPSGTQVVKSLDTLSRLSQVQQDGAPVAGYRYDVTAGTLTQTHGNGLSSLTETDALGRILRLSSPVADYRYGYDNRGNRTYMQRAHQPGDPADVYQYDALSQLTQVWYGADATDPAAISTYDRLQAYTLDPLGNRLEVEDNGIRDTYFPNNGQHLTNPMHRYEQVDDATLDYDLTGNLLTDGSNSYTYDVFNRQISMTNLDRTAEYVYDALGRRVAKIVDGVTTYYVYNADYQVIEERDGSNTLLARYTYGPGIDEVLTVERDGNTYYYHRDGQNSITEISDESGSLVERYEYDVYGEPRIFDSVGEPLAASIIRNRYFYTGRRYDPESGNYYFRARMYSPSLGRFLQMDPLEYEDGMNPYMNRFVINGIDPYGMETIKMEGNGGTLKLKTNDNTGLVERIEVEIPGFFNAEILSYTVKSKWELSMRCQKVLGEESTRINLPPVHWSGGSDNAFNRNCELTRHIQIPRDYFFGAAVAVPMPPPFFPAPILILKEECNRCKITSTLTLDITMVIEMPGPTCGLLYKFVGGKTGSFTM